MCAFKTSFTVTILIRQLLYIFRFSQRIGKICLCDYGDRIGSCSLSFGSGRFKSLVSVEKHVKREKQIETCIQNSVVLFSGRLFLMEE